MELQTNYMAALFAAPVVLLIMSALATASTSAYAWDYGGGGPYCQTF